MKLSGELDIATRPILTAAIDDAATATAGDIVIDLQDVRFIEADAVRVLMAARQQLMNEGRDLMLARLSRSASLVLAVTESWRDLPIIVTDAEQLSAPTNPQARTPQTRRQGPPTR